MWQCKVDTGNRIVEEAKQIVEDRQASEWPS